MRQPPANMQRVVFDCRDHFRIDQLTFACDRYCYPFSLCSVVAHSDQIKTARGQTLSDKHFRNVAHGNNPSAPQDHAFQPWGMVRKSKDTAWGGEFGNGVRRNTKPPFSPPPTDTSLPPASSHCRH